MCTGEFPGNITVTIQCNETDVVFNNIYLVENAFIPVNITGSVSVPQYQQCNISIVFSNEADSSEPFILACGKYLVMRVLIHCFIDITPTTPTMSPTPSPTDDTNGTTTSSPGSTITRPGLSLQVS